MTKLTNSEQGINWIVDRNCSLQHSQDKKLYFIRETTQENAKPRKRKVKFTTMEDRLISGLKGHKTYELRNHHSYPQRIQLPKISSTEP